MIETQIIATKANGKIWYTAQTRKVYFLTRSRWNDIIPIMQPTFDKANELFNTTEKTLINDKYSKHETQRH